MLHILYKSETGNEACGERYELIDKGNGVYEKVLVSRTGYTTEYTEWCQDLIEKLKAKNDEPVLEIEGMRIVGESGDKEKIKELKKHWKENTATLVVGGEVEHHSNFNPSFAVNAMVQGQIKKSHMEGDVKVIDEFNITGVSVNPNDDMAGYVNQD